MPRSKSEQVLAEDGEPPSTTSAKPISQANGPIGPEGQAEQADACGDDASGGGIRRHAVQGRGRAARARRSRNASSRARAPRRRKPRGRTGAPRPSDTAPARGTGSAILTGTSITRLPHPNIAGSKPGRSWALLGRRPLKISSNERVLPPCLRCYSLAKVEPIGHADGLTPDCCEMSPKRRRKYGREQEHSSQSTSCNPDAHRDPIPSVRSRSPQTAIGARRPSARAGISGSARNACRSPWSGRSPWSRRPRRSPISSLA